nr:immunoglobulin heavy chain junction region [Macaca mulatta]MOW80710.1 immunoglobulin heavy chain junction region [Macaca mulatta]MOW81641.1 immunoglobulin heavy chain junction region [Macaca mulatta]MOW84784.1 immunoglobulin heavy chain junction region [Macaca mulatta]
CAKDLLASYEDDFGYRNFDSW